MRSAVSQRRLTIYWQTNERLGRSRAVSGATRFEVWWMRANRAPTAMCHRQRFLALEMFEPARPCSTIAGTKLEDKGAGKRRKWCCSTNTKPKPALGARQSSMPSFRTACRDRSWLAGDQTETSSSRAAPQALQDRRLHRPDAS